MSGRISSVCRLSWASVVACWAGVGCAGAAPEPARASDFDRPVPASEPRATASFVVDLEAATDCEERFDLAIYTHRGVELVAWDEATGACAGRAVQIRYLTGKLDEAALRALVKEHAKAVRTTER